VERTAERDHRAATSRGTRDLHRVLHGLRTGGEQQRLGGSAEGRDGVQALGEFDIGFIRHHLERGVREAAEHFVDRSHHARVAMASAEHADAAGEIDVAATLGVPDLRVFSPIREHRRGRGDAARNGCGTPHAEVGGRGNTSR
jgi:hypothetical protein